MKKFLYVAVLLLSLFLAPNAFAIDEGCDANFPTCSAAGDACYAGCGCPSNSTCTNNGTLTFVSISGNSCTFKDASGNTVTKTCGCYLTSCGDSAPGDPGGPPAGGTTTNIRDEAKELIPINTTLGDYVSRGVNAILLVVALGAFIYLLWGGIDWLQSGGDKERIEKAKSKITNTVIALGVVAAAWAIYLIIDYFFGIGITG